MKSGPRARLTRLLQPSSTTASCSWSNQRGKIERQNRLKRQLFNAVLWHSKYKEGWPKYKLSWPRQSRKCSAKKVEGADPGVSEFLAGNLANRRPASSDWAFARNCCRITPCWLRLPNAVEEQISTETDPKKSYASMKLKESTSSDWVSVQICCQNSLSRSETYKYV